MIRMLMLVLIAALIGSLAMPITAKTSENKTLFSVFYWWYPYYGLQWYDSDGKLNRTAHSDGYVLQDMAGLNPLSQPIPYLRSEERLDGDPEYQRAVQWYYGNFSRAGQAGVDVFLLTARPDLPLWFMALDQMRMAQWMLKREGKPYPLLALMADGVEYWQVGELATDDLSVRGTRYKIVYEGIRDTIKHEASYKDHYFMYRGQWVVFFYRVEGGAAKFTAGNMWLNQLRHDMDRELGENVYAVLDELWCNKPYGGRVLMTCTADNWWLWGANVSGRTFSENKVYPKIASITTGYNGNKPQGFSVSDQYLERSEQSYNERWIRATSADWIVLETWNFIEENSQIDRTQSWGDGYINLTRQFKERWLLGVDYNA